MILWALLVYVSIKIPYQIAMRPTYDMDPRIVPYGLALTTSFCGILIGIFFLSFIYQNLLFIYFGLSGALYGVAKQSSRSFEVRVSRNEILAVVGICLLILGWLFVYTRIKGAP
jgi:hypothetical protein